MKRLICLIASLVWATAHGQSLLPGSKAPKFEPESWVKPDHRVKLRPSRITVVEFWATWCGPCIDQFPHLSDLAEKHKDSIDVVGVNIWDLKDGEKSRLNASRIRRIGDFAKAQERKLRYPICLDSYQETIAKDWMEAAERNTVPTCFVVGRDGRIAWIGHPDELDDVLPKIIARQWDIKQAAKDYRKVVANRKALAERDARTATAILSAAKAGDRDTFEAATKQLGFGPNTNIRRGLEMVVNEAPSFCADFLEKAMWEDTRFDAITVCKLGMLIVEADKGQTIANRGLDICRKAVGHPDIDPELVCYSHCYFAQALYLAGQRKEADKEIEKAKELASNLRESQRKDALEYIDEMVRRWKPQKG